MHRYWLYFLFVLLLPCSCTQNEKNKDARPKEQNALVTIVSAAKKDIPHVIEAVGVINPSMTVTIVSRTAGELQKVLVNDGEYVNKNQVLFEIEKEQHRIAVKQAEARLESDRAKVIKTHDDYMRSQKMNKGGFVSTSENESNRLAYVAAQSSVKEDEASLEKARLELSYCSISTPISGKARAILVDQGNVIPSLTQLTTIDQIIPAEATFSVAEKHLPQIRAKMAGGGIKVVTKTKSGIQVSGSVTYAGNVDSSTGMIPLKAVFSNIDQELWPGEFVRLSLELDMRSQAVVVPSRAVLLGPDGPFVYVVSPDKKAHIRNVTADIEYNGFTVIAQGLAEGEAVVLEGHVRLKNGISVRFADNADAGITDSKQ